ncbi:response regulator transcription factor [Kineosporia sp. A_224]|uniref:response regulator transcription factor n=1 Tax=Kineosporia sp. A_224 TaxID=1962180 RepID=UPI000B4A6B4A|nr:response regulator transcription factor [Kineosporia sp. A_224]
MTDGENGGTAERVRVLVVDDDPLVRSALRLVLGADPRVELVGEAADGVEARAAAASLHPDVVLMDVRMPREDGITATAHLVAGPRPPAVVVLTTFDADETVLAAVRAGASGFLLKDTPPEQILAAVHRVHAGEPMLSPSVTRTVMAAVAAAGGSARGDAARARLEGLGERERQVAVAIGRGLTNAEIAGELYLSVATVKSYVTALLAKLDAANRVQIAIRVHDAGLL